MNDATSLKWTLADILTATGGRLLTAVPERTFGAISIDSRQIAATDLYVAIEGKTHDGHSFVEAVVAQNVKGIVVAANKASACPAVKLKPPGAAVIAVTDTTRALGDLAAFNRRRAGVSVVAITGSNGKTTTREMTTAVLSQVCDVLATRGNLNNEIGLPLTLLRLAGKHRWAVLELGMNHPGEIRRLTEICAPDIGVITNIGPAHLEGLGSIDGVMRAKGELLEAMPPQGTAVLNADDQQVMKLAGTGPRRVTRYGRFAPADITAADIRPSGDGSRFYLSTPAGGIEVGLGLPGEFMVSNALAAAAVGHIAGIPLPLIQAGLAGVRAVAGRMHVIHTTAGIHLIDDSYNANPGSMAAAIDNLTLVGGTHRRVLVAGDMLELGTQAAALHRQIGARAAAAGLTRLYLTGKHAGSLADGAREQGMAAGDIFIGPHDDILAHLTAWLTPGDWVLIKGSRAMGMEKIVQELTVRYHEGT